MERDKLLGGAPPPSYYQQQPPQRQVVIVEHRPAAVVCTLPPPPDQMAFAIVATIFFFPLGLLALYMSHKVRESVQLGDIPGAYRFAYATRMISRISYFLGSFLLVGVILCVVIPIVTSTGN